CFYWVYGSCWRGRGRRLGLRSRGGNAGREGPQQPLSPRLIVVAAGIEGDRAILIASRNMIGVREVRHSVGEIDMRVEQAARGPVVPHGPRSSVPNLHEAVVAAVHCTRIIAALSHDDSVHQPER